MDSYVGPDFTLQDEGTIVLLTPKSEEAQEFIDTHIDPDAQTFCDAVVIEPRYVQPIIAHIEEHGMVVEVIR